MKYYLGRAIHIFGNTFELLAQTWSDKTIGHFFRHPHAQQYNSYITTLELITFTIKKTMEAEQLTPNLNEIYYIAPNGDVILVVGLAKAKMRVKSVILGIGSLG